MGRPGVTEYAVRQAINELLAQGTDPSVKKVQAIVGGSNTTIGAFLRKINDENGGMFGDGGIVEKELTQVVRSLHDRLKVIADQTVAAGAIEAEKAVNAFVRERDRDQPCISCGTNDAAEWHAGHWKSVGANSALRFDPANIHRQCDQCNVFKGGNANEYEIRLPARIGQAEVDRLKHAPRVRKWTREECQAIEQEFKSKLKELREREAA